MAKQNFRKKVVLIALLVLPFLVYFIWVYNSKENFFKTLDYVGPPNIEKRNTGAKVQYDTLPYTVPSFSFTTQQDTFLTSDDLKGKIYVANFFFTSCPTVCPAMNYHVKQVQNRFKGYDYFKIVSFTVDPEHDTPAVLQRYAEKMEAIPGLWYFLTGDKKALYNTAAGYLVNAQEDAAAPGGFLHSEYLVLVDWEGRIRSRTDEQGNLKGVYNGTSLTEVNLLKDDIKVLIAEYEKKKSMDEYRASKEAKD
jgi:protein SCO1/2